MRKLFSVLALVSLAISSLAQSQGVSMRSTNGIGYGNTVINNLIGKAATGSLTNASGSRVAYLSDTNGLGSSGDFVARSGTNMTGGLTNDIWLAGNGVGLTNISATSISSVYASNVISGGVLPAGTVSASTATAGYVLATTGPLRQWTNRVSLAQVDGTVNFSSDTLKLSGLPMLVYNGTGNNFIGIDAATNRSTGNFNTVFGYQAAKDLSGANSDVIVGYQAGLYLTNSQFNTIVGTAAGQGLTGFGNTGEFNTFLGYHAGSKNGTGANNVYVGYRAGEVGTNATDNTFIGADSGFLVQSGGQNVFVGKKAGAATINGGNNVMVGFESGLAQTATDESTFVGYRAGKAVTTGATGNTMIGSQSGLLDTTGWGNTFVGRLAGSDNTVGLWNVAIGIGASMQATNRVGWFVVGSSGQPVTNYFFGKGISNATPVRVKFNGTGGFGTDIAGGDFDIAGGQGTGTGSGGSINFLASQVSATGSGANALANVLTVGPSNTTFSTLLSIKAMGSAVTNAVDLSLWNSNNFAIYVRNTNGVDKLLLAIP